MTAHDVAKAIELRHTKDVLVTECKDGPTWSASHSRMDVWAMKRSWSKPCTYGYEIKVSRSDFRQDTKWPSYLPLCNVFYFACPKDLIAVAECPPEAGLMYCSGTRVREVKKPAWRDVSIPESLAIYLLICRTRVVSPHFYDEPTREHRLERWRKWVKEREDGKELGYEVSRGIRDHVQKVEAENRRLKHQIDQYDQVKSAMERMGIPLDGYTWNLEKRVKAANAVIPESLLDSLTSLGRSVNDVLKEADKLKTSLALEEIRA